MQCTIAGALGRHTTDGFGSMRKRLVAWTILTCALLAIAVWSLLGPPDYAPGPQLPSRNMTAAVAR